MLFFSLWSDGGGHATLRARVSPPCGASQRPGDEISCGRRPVLRSRAPRAIEPGRPARGHARCASTPATSARRSSRPSTARSSGSRTASARASGTRPRPQRRRLLRHAEEVRGRLLPHHDVPRLPDQPDPLPLGVAVDDLGRSPTGQRYLNGSSTVLLFARAGAEGRVRHLAVPLPRPRHYVSHTGDRPIAITWQLDHAMPTDFFNDRRGRRPVATPSHDRHPSMLTVCQAPLLTLGRARAVGRQRGRSDAGTEECRISDDRPGLGRIVTSGATRCGVEQLDPRAGTGSPTGR